MRRIVPVPCVFSWSTFLRLAEMALTLQLMLTSDRFTLSFLMVYASSSVTVVNLVESMVLNPRGYTCPKCVHGGQALVVVIAYAWAIYLFFFAPSRVLAALPTRMFVLLWGAFLCTHCIFVSALVMAHLRVTGRDELANRIERALFDPEPVYIE
jgi:hypothetical protein